MATVLQTNPLTRKLASFADLCEDDVSALDRLCGDTRTYLPGRPLITQGERPECVYLLLKGWACRYKFTPEGDRQIVGYLIPGDLCDIHAFILRDMDHTIATLNAATVAVIPKMSMLTLLRERPEIAQALMWATLVDEAILREWLVNVGRRSAYQRVAHLFCEMQLRMEQVGLADADRMSMPVTQSQIGDTVGLTPVHTNRMLQKLRHDGLLTFTNRLLTILDIDRLRHLASFDRRYLHLDRRRR